LSGSVSGQTFTFTLTQNAPCAGSFTGHGTVAADDSTLRGSYSGSDCGGTVSTTITAARQ